MKNQVNNHQIIRTGILFSCIMVLIFSGNYLFAQITITANDFPHAGMLVVRDIDSTTAVSPGPSGTGQVWDFSNLVASYDDSTLYTTPAGQPGIQNFPHTNLVATDLDYDINYEGGFNHIFYEITPSGWYLQGQDLKLSFWGININWHMFYQPPALMLPLPFTYNDSYSQSTNWKNYIAMGYNGTITDTNLVSYQATISQLADASGTMITPGGTFEVLRVFEHTEIIDSTFNYDPVNGWIFESTGFTILNAYRWYANGIGEVGYLLMDDKKRSGSLNFFKSTTIVGKEEPLPANTIKLYPMPATDKLTIESSDPVQKVVIFNQNGAVMLTENNTAVINVSGLAPGVYYIRVFTQKGVSTQAFIKK